MKKLNFIKSIGLNMKQQIKNKVLHIKEMNKEDVAKKVISGLRLMLAGFMIAGRKLAKVSYRMLVTLIGTVIELVYVLAMGVKLLIKGANLGLDYIYKGTKYMKLNLYKMGRRNPKNAITAFKKFNIHVTPVQLAVFTLMLVVPVATVATTLTATAKEGYEVKVEGKAIGYVKEDVTVKAAVNDTSIDLSKEYQQDVSVDENKVAIEPVKEVPEDAKLLDAKEVEEAIAKEKNFKLKTNTVYANGEPLFTTESKAEAEKLLENLKNKYKKEGVEYTEINFVEDVKVVNEKNTIDTIIAPSDEEKVLEKIVKGKVQEEKYTVVENDTMWSISAKTGKSLDELVQSNPGLDLENIFPGNEIVVTKQVPYISVQAKATLKEEVAVDRPTVYKETSDLYVDEEKLEDPGATGKNLVTKDVVFVNGEISQSTITASEVIAPAKEAVVLKGTKARPTVKTGGYSTYTGSAKAPVSNASLGWPSGGYVSSGWGDGRNHLGIDVCASMGSPIFAAADGVVTSAGYSGSYGNIIKISHGNGLETYYAHNSASYVAPGQTVKRGQVIGAMGATGNATGVHVHFEVRINGVPYNPMLFL